ncbi:MAG: hypothetical protein HKO05_09215 [Erythrobacter sp.]|jgi:hypothetical protein|nr:hypothetical protein [Erythrobacter sp.]
MATSTYRSSRPDAWVQPRPYADPSVRMMKHGPIQPLTQPSLLSRLFGHA